MHCSWNNSGSLLRNSSVEVIKSFSWDAVAADIQMHAPTLSKVFKGCVDIQRRGYCTSKAPHRPNSVIALCVCAAVMLKNRNENMNLFQRLVSLLLNAGHASKQVCCCFVDFLYVLSTTM